jgi:hypothetical protein
MMKDDFLIESVIGFKHRDIPIQIMENDGTTRQYIGGIRSTYCCGDVNRIIPKECNPKWFTNFNQKLLDKIKDYHKNNT